jgi:hypothetical protein
VHTHEGTKTKYLYGKTRKDVAAKLAGATADRNSGLVFDSGSPKIGEYLDRWLDSIVRTCSSTGLGGGTRRHLVSA